MIIIIHIKVGTWIRLRNFQADTPAKVIYSLPSTESSTSVGMKTRGRPRKKKDTSIEPTTAWLIGLLDPMTHISVMLPTFK
jgi:hypothetical protein